MRHLIAAVLIFLSGITFANVETLIIDTGSGHASVTRFPNGDIMVFDTGHWSHDASVFEKFTNFIGDADIDLLVASHSDSDHLAATDELFNNFRIHRVIRTGFERGTGTWRSHNSAINAAASNGLTHDINLDNSISTRLAI